LYDASLAAHRRGRRLDPKLDTSVHHTHFQRGEVDELEGRDLLHALRGDDAKAIELLRGNEGQSTEGNVRAYVDCVLAAIEGRVEDCNAAYRKALDTGLKDPEHEFYFARALSRAGAGPEALGAAERVIGHGFYCVLPLRNDPWLDAARAEPGFGPLLERAEAGRRRAVAAYRDAGGEKLLGAREV
jgi:hypothetical protein